MTGKAEGVKIYISGPMTQVRDFNIPAFNAAAKALSANRWIVVNPAVMVKPKHNNWSDFLRDNIRALMDCDAVAYLPGHETSKQSRLELHVARELGMVVKPVEWWLDDGQWV